MTATHAQIANGSSRPLSHPIRALYERARDLPLAQQIQECVDHLQNPELIESELLESCGVVRSYGTRDRAEAPPRIEREHRFFYESRDLFVHGSSSSFTCLATDVDPRLGGASDPPGQFGGLDFVGMTCEAKPRMMLGVHQGEEETGAYPLLLRSLACLVELLDSRTLVRVDRESFHGMLGELPRLDLAIVIWDAGEEDWERTPICEFTRDLAEVVKRKLAEESAFPNMLGDILCLRMNAVRFDGRVRFEWRV